MHQYVTLVLIKVLVIIKCNWFLAKDCKTTTDFIRSADDNDVIYSPIETPSIISMLRQMRLKREFAKRQNSFPKGFPMKDTLHPWGKLWPLDHMTKKNEDIWDVEVIRDEI